MNSSAKLKDNFVKNAMFYWVIVGIIGSLISAKVNLLSLTTIGWCAASLIVGPIIAIINWLVNVEVIAKSCAKIVATMSSVDKAVSFMKKTIVVGWVVEGLLDIGIPICIYYFVLLNYL